MKNSSYLSNVHRTVLASTTAIGMMFFAGGAIAQADATVFDIPAQSVSSALVQYGAQVKKEIVAPDNLLTGLTSSPVKGRYDTVEALNKLLAGTNLKAVYIDANTISVAPADPLNKPSAAPRPKTPVVAGGRESDGENTLASSELEEIVVQAKRRASTATKFELSVIDTPQSIKAVTTDVLDFASIRDFSDLEKVDASTSTKGRDITGQSLSFRGFDYSTEEGLKIDGAAALSTFPTDFIVFDRIEVLKGASSSIYGQNAIGGMVNAVLKRPLSTFGGFVGGKIGSWGYHRVEGDVTGPLTQDGRLSFRAIAAYEEGGDFIDFGKNKSKVAYGALKYDFDEATSATVMVEYQERVGTPNRGLAVTQGTFTMPDVPASRFYGAPWSNFEGHYFHTEAEINHKFSNNWLLKLNTQYARASHVFNANGAFGFFDTNGDLRNPDGSQAIIQSFYANADPRRQWTGELSLTGDFDLFGRSNTFYVGVDRRVYKNRSGNVRSDINQFLNLFNPDYSVFNSPRTGPGDYPNATPSLTDRERAFWGGSVQLLLHPVDRLSVLMGLRWDKSKISSERWNGQVVGDDIVPVGASSRTELNTTKLVPQVGVTFEIQPDINLYATYGRSFIPQTGVTFEGRLIKPEEGSQIEGGVKANFGLITTTLAVFDMKRTHIVGFDPEHTAFDLEIGDQSSKGVEFDIFGNIMPGWSIYGSVAYVDAKVSASNQTIDIGTRLFNIPKYSLSLYSDYQFQSGPLSGLGFGGGIVTKQDRVWGQSSVALLGRQVNPGGYTTVDLRLFYEIGNVMFDFKANNVFNEKYYQAPAPAIRTAIFPGRPREFIGSVKYKF